LGLNNSFGVGIRTTAGLFGSEELSTLLELLVELESTDATSVVLSREEDVAKSLQVVVHKFHSYKLKHVCSSTSPTYLVT
jgi:CRISPR/Cas system type I-B associated protein Csh2 (Cas7 group RAMP superfamily)